MTEIFRSFRFRLLAVFFLLFVGNCAGPGEASRGKTDIVIRGSDTMEIVVDRWAREYMRLHPDVAIRHEGGGSERGIEALIDGTADIAAASRTLLPSEVKKLLVKEGSLGVTHYCAKDALSVFRHPGVQVKYLTLADVYYIFTGKKRNWKEFGGPDLPIIILSRDKKSGTELFFEEHVLHGEQHAADAFILPTTDSLVSVIRSLPGTIGYGGIAYGDTALTIRINGAAPTAENVRNGSYPLARYLYLFTPRPPQGKVRDFIDWILSDVGQKIAKNSGYVPLWDIP